MRKAFICSLCAHGLLGGGIFLEPHAVTYRTNKLTVDDRYRCLVMPMADIQALTWKWRVFPVATFHMRGGDVHRFVIFEKKRFSRYFRQYHNQ